MPRNKDIILIPFWVAETMKRNQLPLNQCLSFEKIKPLMSLNDLISFLVFQTYTNHVLGSDIYIDLAAIWKNSVPEDKPKLRNECYLDLPKFALDAVNHKEVWDRIFDPTSKHNSYDEKQVPFTVHDLTPELLGIVINPGFFTEPVDPRLQISLIESILKVLYVYDAYHEVAKTSLFKRYLDLLATNY